MARVGEHLGRLKINDRIATRSPMTTVLEMELMRSAVLGKRGAWQVLADNAQELGLDAERFRDLAEQAMDQHEQLDEIHASARRRTFSRDEPLTGCPLRERAAPRSTGCTVEA